MIRRRVNLFIQRVRVMRVMTTWLRKRLCLSSGLSFSPGVYFDDPGQLADAQHLAVGDVADAHFTHERNLVIWFRNALQNEYV